MNKDSKRISTSLRPDIDRIKGYIQNSTKPFDGMNNYIFKTALKELKEQGIRIKYITDKCHYITY